MSFLNEVLVTADEADLLTLKKKVPIFTAQLTSTKEEVIKFVDNAYIQFSEWPKHNQKLLDQSTQLLSELNSLQQKIEQVTLKEIDKNNVDIKNLSDDLDRSNVKLVFITRIIEIHETLLTIRSLQQDRMYIKAAYALINLEVLVDSIPEEERMDVILVLKGNIALEKSAVLRALCDMFHHVIEVHSKVTNNNVQTNTIKIVKKGHSITELFEVLDLVNGYSTTLERVSNFILEVCKGVIHNVTSIKLHDEGTYHVLVIAIKKTIVKCEHKEVFTKLIEIFSFLYAHFDYSIGNELTTMRYFGNIAGAAFSDVLIKDCLERTKPTHDSEYANYEKIINSIIKFQEKLVEFNIFGNDNPILQYAKHMDELLIEQKCNQYLAGAISLMKKDLHDSIDVGIKCEDGKLLAPEHFPRSTISRSVLDILELVRTLLQEAQEVSEQCATRLICTAQSIFYQYGNIVHGHHERLLATIPQQVALFRNNCLFIAHALVQINAEFSGKFPKRILQTALLFPDQGHQLQTIGGEIFLGYIDDQVRLMEGMVDQYLPVTEIADQLNPDLEKLIRQCLRQYELLRTVWMKILPHSVYNKSIGYLFNAFCKKLITTVISATDIPTKNAELLVETFKVVVSRGPKLFSNTQEVALHVDSWAKLNDLVFILGTNLIGISDRWADGKGVLTLTFPADEVRKLIKALFQNTDRRAAVLNRIN